MYRYMLMMLAVHSRVQGKEANICRVPSTNAQKERRRTEPLEVSTDQPICRPSPPKVSKKSCQLLMVSSVCCSPCQSSSSSGDMDSLSSGSISRDILPGCTKGECSSTSSMKSTWGAPSVLGRPPPDVSRPKETSFGRGFGRCVEPVLSLGGSRGEASGDVDGEGDDAPSGCVFAMLAVAGRIVLRWLWLARRGPILVAYCCEDRVRVIGRRGWLVLSV